MEMKDFMSPEWPRWISGLGFYVMSSDADDDTGWSERKGYYVNYNPGTQLWTLTITTNTVQKEEDGGEFEENSEENFGPHDLGKFREILSTYEIELDVGGANEIIKRMTNPHLL
jgi:hypothetical protein